MLNNSKTYKKKDMTLKEGVNVAANTSGHDKTASQYVQNARSETPSATSVTVPADEINGSDDATATVNLPANQVGYSTAQKMSRQLGSDAKSTNFQFDIQESVTFTQAELSRFLKTL